MARITEIHDEPKGTLIDELQRRKGTNSPLTQQDIDRHLPEITKVVVDANDGGSARPVVFKEDDLDLDETAQLWFKVLDLSMWLIPLTSVYVVLFVLVKQQYSTEIELMELVTGTIKALITLTAIQLYVHPYRSRIQFLLFVVATFIGGYLVYTSNEEGYYAVMKKAPPLGTICVWLFVELEIEYAVVTLAIIGVYMYVNGFKM